MQSDTQQRDDHSLEMSNQQAPPLNGTSPKTPHGGSKHPHYVEMPEYEISLKTGHVVFDQLVVARHALCLRARHVEHLEKVQEDSVRWTFAHYLPKLWQLYEKTEGKILEYYFCYEILAGAVLSKKGELVVRYLPQDVARVSPGFESTFWKCTVQARLAKELLLRWGGRMALLQRLFALTVYLLTVLDSQSLQDASDDASTGAAAGNKEEAARIKRALHLADAELRDTEIELRRLARRDTQWIYLLGMAPSIVLLAVILVAKIGDSSAIESLFAAIAAGGLGATVSVLNRASTGKLNLDYHAGWALTGVSGFFRPVTGAIFGLATYVFLNAGLIQIAGLSSPSGTETRGVFFFSAIAFVAGFSERWAKDILSLSTPTRSATATTADSPEKVETDKSGAEPRISG